MPSPIASGSTHRAASTCNCWPSGRTGAALRGRPSMTRATLAAIRPSRSRSCVDTQSRSRILRELLLYLASERGLAENSIHAYRRDLEDIERFLHDKSTTL